MGNLEIKAEEKVNNLVKRVFNELDGPYKNLAKQLIEKVDNNYLSGEEYLLVKRVSGLFYLTYGKEDKINKLMKDHGYNQEEIDKTLSIIDNSQRIYPEGTYLSHLDRIVNAVRDFKQKCYF